jgi:hypothetical protein
MKLRDSHQGLWNSRLLHALRLRLPRPAFEVAARVIVAADTAALAGRAIRHRFDARRVGSVPPGVAVYYFDLGTHREAAELRHMVDHVLPGLGVPWYAFGFEASAKLFEEAQNKLGGRSVMLTHAAVCYRPPSSGTLRLYTGGNGLANSLYRPELDAFEDVPAVRLSDWLGAQGIDFEGNIVLVRMNIEGAERDVIADLNENRLLLNVDGWFGMWDDLSKIDPAADEVFRAELAAHSIEPVTFNGRDLRVPLRLRVIDAEVRTAVRRGARRIWRARL